MTLRKKSVHEVRMTRTELARATRPGPLLSPLSAEELEAKTAKDREEMRRIVAGTAPKPRRASADLEHRAQRRLFEVEIPDAMTRWPEYERELSAVYAIPVFNASTKGPKAKMVGARMKAEGQKAGSPDVHVPVPKIVNVPGVGSYVYGSLYLELKAEHYPNDAQRERFPLLAYCRNAVVTVREPDEIELAGKAITTIVRYLRGRADFYEFGHNRFTYVHNSDRPLSDPQE